MDIPTYGVVLMAVGIPLFVLVGCCCYCYRCGTDDDDDIEKGKEETKERQPVTKPDPNPSPRVGHAPPVEVKKKQPEPLRKNDGHNEAGPSTPNQRGKPALSPSSSNGAKLSRSQRFESIKLKSYEYEELAAATDWFSNVNLLGEGGFGAVYVGTFPNGDVLAIKKLKYEAGVKENEFEAEILTISRIHHKNLVKLVGYCSDEANRLIVYEFLPNNSLKSHLHGRDRQILSWSNRMKIAKGSAEGLAYLHQGCNPIIIHRDIKADNILLGNNFEPKIADFGLARDLSHSVTHISTDPKGTHGYVAPEYWKERRLTDKSDVFSFGVVLLELITGKKHVFFQETSIFAYNLAVWAMPQIKEAVEFFKYKDVVDPNLREEYINEDELARIIHCAAACVYKPAGDRPNMRQVAEALQGNIPLEQIWTKDDSRFLYDGAPYESFPQQSPEISGRSLSGHF